MDASDLRVIGGFMLVLGFWFLIDAGNYFSSKKISEKEKCLLRDLKEGREISKKDAPDAEFARCNEFFRRVSCFLIVIGLLIFLLGLLGGFLSNK